MKSRKIIAMALVGALLLSVFMYGCSTDTTTSSEGDTGTPATSDSTASTDQPTEEKMEITFPLEEQITITALSTMHSNGPVAVEDTMAMKKMEELTNVKFEVESYLSADLEEKTNLMLNSGRYPEVFFKYVPDPAKYGEEGIYIELENLIADYAPNLSALMAERPLIETEITYPDGHIYTLPHMMGRSDPAAIPLFINQAWLDTLDMEQPTSIDEFHAVLTAFKNDDPNGNGTMDEIPFAVGDYFPLSNFIPYFGIEYNPSYKTTDISGELEYVPAMEEYKEMLIFFEQLYSEGLLDANAFTQSGEQLRAIGASEDTIGVFFDYGAFLTVGRERDPDFPMLMAFDEGVYPATTGISTTAYAITDICENPEIAMAWADMWYSEEGGRLAWMGVEDESYKINDDGSWEWIMGDYESIGEVRANAAIQGSGTQTGIQPELWWMNVADANEAKINEERLSMMEIAAEPTATLKISPDDNSTIASIKADIDPYLDQYMAEIVTGNADIESTWDNYVDTLNQMGLEEMMAIYNKAYDEVSQ